MYVNLPNNKTCLHVFDADWGIDGTHSLSSPSHLSLLFAKTFNISIPLQHIPQNLYQFEHAESPDHPPSEDESDEEDEGSVVGNGLGGTHVVEEVGRWRNVQTGKMVGEEGGKGLKFTVIGQVALSSCSMLSKS